MATLKTRGSVGLDESLELVVEVPVRDEWIPQNKQLASLRGLARDAFTAPVENLLENELQKGLNRLLPAKKKP
ncbi:MAG: hypothetical protein DWI21_13630 [Planctomycetota bacterium]|nr:MAG: hypothetical protein DWI21_13630 [Planctomycetota bacterium]GDY10221.1 hypothetical protein LBMAG52_37090 [Planctomycetia bacterium]